MTDVADEEYTDEEYEEEEEADENEAPAPAAAKVYAVVWNIFICLLLQNFLVLLCYFLYVPDLSIVIFYFSIS